MKVYTNKFNDSFYLPVTNSSSRDELGYQVVVNDTYGLLSIENTVGPGPKNDVYITVPKVPSVPVVQGTLYANKTSSGGYYIQITAPSQIFNVYEDGKRFYLFYSDGTYSSIYVDFIGYEGEFPRFLIDETSLKKILGGSPLPTESSPVLLNSQYSLSTEFETRNFLKVSTSTQVKGQQKASITLRGLQTNTQTYVYEFIIDPVDSPVVQVSQPPIGIKMTETAQLARSFVPMSSVVTLQVDSQGSLYMDKLYSGSSTSQTGYRRRCTNLGFEKDLSRFCSSIPRPSLYAFNQDDIKTSTPVLSEQYFTDVNAGASINIETEEGFRIFAPLWLKDMVPSYFAIFRRDATNSSTNLLEGASLVRLVDIQKTELGGYLQRLMENDNFSNAPLEVSIDNGYQLKWNGVSVETGYWVSHTEFINIDIQQGLSDFEFNRILSSGFSRGSIVSPQLLNIEFLFDDNEAKLYSVNQYFGMYCDDVEISRFIPNIDSTYSLFRQNETRQSSNRDFNSSVISNPEGVKLVVDLNQTPDRNFVLLDPSTMVINSQKVPSRYPVRIVQTTASSRALRLEFNSDTNITASFPNGSTVRLEDGDMNFVSYVTVSSSSYNQLEKKMVVTFVEKDTYSKLRLSYWINVFDFSPDPSPSIKGRMRFDSPELSKSKCIVLSDEDVLGGPVDPWIDSLLGTRNDVRECIVVFDKSSSSYATLNATSVKKEGPYVKLFFDVLESKGSMVEGDQTCINITDYTVSGAVPGPEMVSSTTRKFILKTKDAASSVKAFDFLNYKNSIVGVATLDSKTFNLGTIVGTQSDASIPVELVGSPYTGISINFSSSSTEPLLEGDRITVEQTVGRTKKRWSVIRSKYTEVGTYKLSGAVTELSIVEGTLVSNDKYTELEISSGSYFPVSYDEFSLTGSTSLQSDVSLVFISAEEQDNGNYLLTFKNTGTPQDYQTLRITSPSSEFTYFDYSPNDSLSTVLAVAFQRFADCPVRSATSNGSLMLYSSVGQTDLSFGIYASYGSISSIEVNGTSPKTLSVFKDGSVVFSNYYIYNADKTSNRSIYSMDVQFLSRILEGTKVLSKSGSPSTAILLNNGSYGIPDIRSIVEQGEERILVMFDEQNTPSLLNERLQLLYTNTVAMSLLSFYRVVDLDFFDEIPERITTDTGGISGTIFSSGASIFSQRDPSILNINRSIVSSKKKMLTLYADIAENIYSDWKSWDPSKDPSFLKFGNLKGTVGYPDVVPITWNPSYGFKIQYLNPSKQWIDYQLNYPTSSINPPIVKYYSVNPKSDPMWELSFDDASLYPSINPSFYEIQAILDSLLGYMDTASSSERLRAFSEVKRLVSYCFKELSKENIDQTQDPATYRYTMVLSVDEEHLDYRYVSTFPDGTYTVKEEDDIQTIGERSIIDVTLNGVPRQNILSNFAASLDESDGKTKMTIGRWKRKNTQNVDFGPYLINVDPLLLPYDMFVNGTENNTTSTAFSLDWYLISGWPKFYPLDMVETNYQYIGKRISIDDLKSIQYDYFTDYLTVGHGEEIFINGAERQGKFLWTHIEKAENGYSTTFKGIPLVFSSPKVDLTGCRFAAILQVDTDIDTPSKVSLVYNQAWNCMTLFVQLKIDSYFIDGSISLEQLYKLSINVAETNESILYGPMMVYGSQLLNFDKVDRAYNEEEIVITNEPIETDDYYEYNQYQYEKLIKIKYDAISKDIELFGIKYFPNVDYIVHGTLFYGTRNQTKMDLIVPRSRVRGVFDPSTGSNRLFIDGLYGDDFFAVLSDIDGSPIATYATFVSSNTIRINGVVNVSNAYYTSPTQISLDETTVIQNVEVYAIGNWPVYIDTVNEASVSSIISRLQSKSFDDILVSTNGTTSQTNMTASYAKPSVMRPSVTKNATVDEFGRVNMIKRKNEINIFRLDGKFEPSYKEVVSFAAAEDVSITKQLLNSLRGYNTQVLRTNNANTWYRRVSSEGVDIGSINVNDTTVIVPYAIGRKEYNPLDDVWGVSFYSKAEDRFIDSPVSGLQDPKDHKFFFSSKVMSVPSFFRTSAYSISDTSSPSNIGSSVTYMTGETRLSIQVDFSTVISDHLFNSGVFDFFSSISEQIPDINPYNVSKEYIERNLLDRYIVESIDVYQRPSSRTEVTSSTRGPELEGYVYVNTIGIQAKRFFDFSVPIDGSKQVVLAFNIKRR